MRISWLLPLLLVAPVATIAQDISGTVIDGDSNQPMVGAVVSLPALRRIARTDAHGVFRFLHVPRGRHLLTVGAIGHAGFADSVALGDSVHVVLQPEDIHASDIVVTAEQEHAHLSVAVPTMTVRATDLNAVQATTLAAELQDQPGLAVRSNGSETARPVVRGMGDARVQLLEDGQPGGDLSAGAPDHAVTIDPATVEHVDVRRGPEALLYASDALTGVLDVTQGDVPTVAAEHGVRTAFVRGASATGDAGAGLTLTQPFGSWMTRVAVDAHHAADTRTPRGLLVNSDARDINGAGGLSYVSSDLTAGAAVRTYASEYGIPVPTDSEPRTVLDPRRTTLSGRLQWAAAGRVVTILSADAATSWYTHDERDRASDALHTSFALASTSAAVRAQLPALADGGQSTAGVSFTTQVTTVRGEEKLTPDAHALAGAAFAYASVPAGPLVLQAGARFDRQQLQLAADSTLGFGSDQTLAWNGVSGSVQATWAAAEGVSITASIGQSFRAPSLEEVASNNFHDPTRSFDIGALTRAPGAPPAAERGLGTDVDVTLHLGRIHGTLSGYLTTYSGFFYRAFRGDSIQGAPVYTYRQDDARLAGADAHLEADLGHGLFATAAADVVRGTRAPDNTNLPAMPPPHLTLGMRMQRDVFWCSAELRGAFAQTRVAPEEAAFAGSTAAAQTAGSAVVNLSAGLHLTTASLVHTLTLTIDNLLDQEYRDHLSVIKWFAPQMGRSFGLNYQVAF